MTRLKCLIGSIGFVGKECSVKCGDIFETTDAHTRALVKQGYAQILKKTKTTTKEITEKDKDHSKKEPKQVLDKDIAQPYGDVKK